MGLYDRLFKKNKKNAVEEEKLTSSADLDTYQKADQPVLIKSFIETVIIKLELYKNELEHYNNFITTISAESDTFKRIVDTLWSARIDVIQYYKNNKFSMDADMLNRIETSDAICVLNDDFVDMNIPDQSKEIYYGTFQQIILKKIKFINRSNNELKNINNAVDILKKLV